MPRAAKCCQEVVHDGMPRGQPMCQGVDQIRLQLGSHTRRPIDKKLRKKSKLPSVKKLWTVEEKLGGWDRAQSKFFSANVSSYPALPYRVAWAMSTWMRPCSAAQCAAFLTGPAETPGFFAMHACNL